MRVQSLSGNDSEKAAEFSEFLLRVREGKEHRYEFEMFKDIIKLPENIVRNYYHKEFISAAYPEFNTK